MPGNGTFPPHGCCPMELHSITSEAHAVIAACRGFGVVFMLASSWLLVLFVDSLYPQPVTVYHHLCRHADRSFVSCHMSSIWQESGHQLRSDIPVTYQFILYLQPVLPGYSTWALASCSVGLTPASLATWSKALIDVPLAFLTFLENGMQ